MIEFKSQVKLNFNSMYALVSKIQKVWGFSAIMVSNFCFDFIHSNRLLKHQHILLL